MRLIKQITSFDPEDPLAPVDPETRIANRALLDYAQMGPKRAMKQLEARYKEMEAEWKKNPKRVQRPPTISWVTLSNWSSAFRWRERTAAYDELVRKEELTRYMEDRVKWREHRLKAAKGLLSKALIGLQGIDPTHANLAQISKAIQTAMEELRIEFDEENARAKGDIVIRVVREDKKSSVSVVEDDDD
jgi:hypothetical protein